MYYFNRKVYETFEVFQEPCLKDLPCSKLP